MISSSANFSILCSHDRWKVEFFLPTEGEPNELKLSKKNLVPLRHLVEERKETISPAALGDSIINYVGLEHIQPFTGELTGFSPRTASSVKSRSKVFNPGDTLYGRLRPNLNKVWVAYGDVAEGICSTEFFVLIPAANRIRPVVLRYLLSSNYVQHYVTRLLTGTALPRIDLDDLLAIEVPVPDMETQQRLEKKLLEDFARLVELRARLEKMPEQILREFLREIDD